jgi:hypothetical protein
MVIEITLYLRFITIVAITFSLSLNPISLITNISITLVSLITSLYTLEGTLYSISINVWAGIGADPPLSRSNHLP